MASESVTILIEAEDQASARLAEVKNSLGGMQTELDGMGESLGEVADRTDALTEKTGGWIGKLEGVVGKASLVISTFVGGFAVGTRIGEWVFQTKEFAAALKIASDETVRLLALNAKREESAFNRKLELFNLGNPNEADRNAFADAALDKIEKERAELGLQLIERQRIKKLADDTFGVLSSQRQLAAEKVSVLETQIAALDRQHALVSEETREYEKQKAVLIEKNQLAQKQVDIFNEYARMADEKNKADEKALEKANKEAEDFFDNMAKMHDDQNKRDEKQAEKDRADAKKAEDKQIAQAQKALSVEAKLRADAYKAQNVPDLQATESRLLTGSSSQPIDKVVINTAQIVAYMAAEQAKLDAMVTALENSNNPTFNVLP